MPQDRDEALAGLLAEARADPPNPGNVQERLPDEGNAERLAAFLAGDAPTVVYFGKLLQQQGRSRAARGDAGVDARTVVVGFGDYRAELERLAPAARRSSPGRSSIATSCTCSPLADACVVPSIFPEAFGMVAAEAAAAGCPPLVARHSGLAEVAEGLEAEYPPELRGTSRPSTTGDAPTSPQAARAARPAGADRAGLARAAARVAAVERWSLGGRRRDGSSRSVASERFNYC